MNRIDNLKLLNRFAYSEASIRFSERGGFGRMPGDWLPVLPAKQMRDAENAKVMATW
jgi:hypothetical protein